MAAAAVTPPPAPLETTHKNTLSKQSRDMSAAPLNSLQVVVGVLVLRHTLSSGAEFTLAPVDNSCWLTAATAVTDISDSTEMGSVSSSLVE